MRSIVEEAMLEHSPLVTIVVLTYHKFDRIKNNLESIAKQEYPHIEVLIQDDGSANFDRAYLEGLCNATLGHRKWRVHQNEQNLGTVRSFNAAIAMADGEFVFPLSQDDRFYRADAVTKLVAFFKEHPDCMSCTSYRMGEKSKKVYPNREDAQLLKSWDRNELWCRIAYENFISGSTIYYRTEFLKKRGCFDTDFLLVEDYPFVASMILENHRIGFFDEITIVYGEDGISNTMSRGAKLLADRMAFYEKYIEPNEDLIGSKWIKAYIAYLYGDIRCGQSVARRIWHHLRSWKVVVRLLYEKYVRRLTVEERYHLWKQ